MRILVAGRAGPRVGALPSTLFHSGCGAYNGSIVGGSGLDFDPSAFINCSWGLRDINQDVAGVAAALADQLSEQEGRAGGAGARAGLARLLSKDDDGAQD